MPLLLPTNKRCAPRCPHPDAGLPPGVFGPALLPPPSLAQGTGRRLLAGPSDNASEVVTRLEDEFTALMGADGSIVATAPLVSDTGAMISADGKPVATAPVKFETDSAEFGGLQVRVLPGHWRWVRGEG